MKPNLAGRSAGQMNPGTRRAKRNARAALAALAAVGCAGPGALNPAGGLDQARAALTAGAYLDARDAYRIWLAARPGDARAELGLAAAYEGLHQLDSARAAYARVEAARPPAGVRRELENRMRLLARRQLAEAARAAVTNEAAYSARPPRPNTIAVLPFHYLGADAQYQPLARGLAQLVMTDLAQVGSLTVLERERAQWLLDELRLAQLDLTEPATGARSGRMLGAERVIQGSFQDLAGERLRVDGAAVATTSGAVAAAASADDQLRRMFDVEKTVVFDLLRRLGVSLTDAERERIAERPTGNLLAFLAFSRGLAAEDRDAFAEAAREYREAARLDPSFRQAGERAAVVRGLAQAREATLPGVAGLLDPVGDLSFLTDQLNDVMGSGMRSVERTQEPRGTGPPSARDPVGDVGGEDRLGGFGTFLILVRRP